MSLVNDPTQFKITHKIEGWDLRPPKEMPVSASDVVYSNLETTPKIYKNAPKSLLMQKALMMQQAELGPHGELVVLTGSHTGRAADDKYVVYNEKTASKIWWDNNIKAMGEEVFEALANDVEEYLHSRTELFSTARSIGTASHYALNIDFYSEMPSAALFTEYMFKERQAQARSQFKILHAPFFEMDPFKYGTRSDTVIATSFEQKCIVIVGTKYAGEIKKSMFSVMNFLTVDDGILPMHAGANINDQGESFVFFGLSGTGKTTLSHDEKTLLVGDDEHGLSSQGLFNFEGGCYAKTYKLNHDHEPEIFDASTRFSALLENVKMDPETREIDFSDASMTENGRASYPLEFVRDRVPRGEGPVPKDVFFLTADAFGVLPPVSHLNLQQAVDYFVLGYTAKVAGTELKVKEPKATFSPCFGAPFMLRHPMEYAKLLAEYLEKNRIRVWLVNTGWSGGPAGVGQRFPIPVTRQIIRAIQNHELDVANFYQEEIFGLRVPHNVRDLDDQVLNPINAWKSKDEYQKAAIQLRDSFTKQLAKFRH